MALITEDELGARRDGIENAADLVAYELARGFRAPSRQEVVVCS